MSATRPGRLALEDAEGTRALLRANVARLAEGQREARALFFKYSTPVGRPPLWPVFAPLCALPEFRVLVAWRRPVDTVYSAFRRFYRAYRPELLGVAAAALTYVRGVRHIRRQLRQVPREQLLELRYEEWVADPEPGLRAICAFAGVDYCPVEQLLPEARLEDQNRKWQRAVRRRLGLR